MKDRYSAQSWIVVFSAALFFFYIFMQLNLFNALNVPLMKEFHVSAMQLGQLSTYYFYSDVMLLFPAGILLDRFSVRKITLCAMGLAVFSAFLFAMSPWFWLTKVCRFLTGVGGAFGFLSSIRLASRWFPPQRLAFVIGLIVTLIMMGGMLAQTPFTWLTDELGWRHALLIDTGLGSIIFFIIMAFVKDHPQEQHQDIHSSQFSKSHLLHSLRLTINNTQNWLGGIYTSLLNLPILLLGGLWGSMYLVQAHHLTRIQSSLVTSMIFIGTIFGSPIIGWLSDRILLRRAPMIVCAILSLGVILSIIYLPHLSLYSLLILFLLLGLFTSAQIVSYPLIAESNPPTLTASANGLASVLIMGAGVTQLFFGWLMDLKWDHQIINNIPIYSINDYRLAMSIFPIAFVFGLLAAILIKETYCRELDFSLANKKQEIPELDTVLENI